MDQSKALHKLSEMADLITMVESLLDPAVIQHLSPTSLSGMRITLRSVKEGMMASHDTLASSLVTRSRPAQETQIVEAPPLRAQPNAALVDTKRRDLRATIERFSESLS